MSLYHLIKENYPEISDDEFGRHGSIELRNDADGAGDYIAKWEYSKPIPAGLKLGKD